MEGLGVAVGVLLLASGLGVVVAVGVRERSRRGLVAYLYDVDGAGPAEPDAEMPSVADRVLRPLGRKLSAHLRSLYPGSHLDRLHRRILHAGLSAKLRAEEMATLQVACVGLSAFLAVAIATAGHGSLKLRFLAAGLVLFCGALGPHAWLSRKVGRRTARLERDLPDVLDLLTIAVESGLGLEQAMEAACDDFDSPVSEEMARTLQEMGLGLSRHDAFENLRERSASADLSNFVVVLTQADALGMPVGRVLRAQADEMRERRRARAREQAAKLPVKILFPLLFFILPVLVILVMGPAAAAIARIFRI